MGARRSSGARLEAPYTQDLETPHVKWASPLPGGPIRLLAVPTVDEGRTVLSGTSTNGQCRLDGTTELERNVAISG